MPRYTYGCCPLKESGSCYAHLGPVIDNGAEHQYVSGHHPSSFLRKRRRRFKSRADKEKNNHAVLQ
jgi:hypothetical protein